MKKIVSLMLILTMILSLNTVSLFNASAATTDISDKIFNTIRDSHSNFEIEKDDVSFKYIKELTGNKYLVRYTVSCLAYSCDVPRIDIGRYILISSRPLPEVYVNGRLYHLEDAYEGGILTDEDLELMDTFKELDFSKTKISHSLKSKSGSSGGGEYVNVMFEVEGSEKTIEDIENWTEDIVGSMNELEAFYDTLHERLINETLSEYDHIDIHHNEGMSLVAVKKTDVEKIAQDDFVQYMDFVNEIHAKYIDTYNSGLSKDHIFEYITNGFDENYNCVYTLIKAHGNYANCISIGFRLGDVIVSSDSIYSNFAYKYGVYDYEEDKFYDLFDLIDTPDKYRDLQEKLVEYCNARIIGDCDNDKVLTVLDATKIQRMIAKIDAYPKHYSYQPHSDKQAPGYTADVNYDGEISVLDATAVQQKLAQI